MMYGETQQYSSNKPKELATKTHEGPSSMFLADFMSNEPRTSLHWPWQIDRMPARKVNNTNALPMLRLKKGTKVHLPHLTFEV
jgi:hypothetical protein